VVGLTQPTIRPDFFAAKTTMNDTKIEEALRLFKQAESAPAMTEYELEQQRIHANLKRLKAERLARERMRDRPSEL
jgi:hypothetical protein